MSQLILKPQKKLKAIFWDFDGVLLNSNPIRDRGFEEVLKDYPEEQVKELLSFHQANGGLSRYVKFRYFFETIRGESVSDEQIQEWANRFSDIMRKLLTDPSLQIAETIAYVMAWHDKIQMYIVSGSDQEELRFLCREHDIAQYFKRIHGSPIPKKEWVKAILQEESIDEAGCVLIGDSINDYEAASANNISFLAYNNNDLINRGFTPAQFNP